MEIPLGMKRTLSAIALLLFATVAVAQTDLYLRYADREGVRVASVSGFEIDSTNHADVTLIEAITDQGWQWMKQEFGIADLAPQQEASLTAGTDAVFFARRSRLRPADNAPVRGESLDVAASCFLGVSYLGRAVYIFCAENEEQYDAIAALLVRKLLHASR